MATKRNIFIPPFGSWEEARNVLAKAVASIVDTIQSLPVVTTFGGQRLQNVGDPQAAQDVVTRAYLETQIPSAPSGGSLIPYPSVPPPSASGRGGVKTQAAVTHKFVSAINADGTVTMAQPSGTDVLNPAPTVQAVVTGSRSLGTVFQNTGTTPMFLTVVLDLGGSTTTIQQAQALTDASNPPATVVDAVANFNLTPAPQTIRASLHFTVLPNNFYKVIQALGTPSLILWTEWT